MLYLLILSFFVFFFVFTYNLCFYFVLLPILAKTLMVRFTALGTRISNTEKCIQVKIYTHDITAVWRHTEWTVTIFFFIVFSLCSVCLWNLQWIQLCTFMQPRTVKSAAGAACEFCRFSIQTHVCNEHPCFSKMHWNVFRFLSWEHQLPPCSWMEWLITVRLLLFK